MRTARLVWLTLVMFAVPGCAWFERPPIEALAQQMIAEVISPAVRDGLAQGIAAHQMQAGAQAVNPAYVADFEGFWVVGLKGRVRIAMEGVAGQGQWATQGGEQTSTSPHQAGQP